MTMAEVNLAAEAFNEGQSNKQKLLAWHAANIMSPHVKKRIKPSDLIRTAQPRTFNTKAEMLAHMRRRKKEIAEKKGATVGDTRRKRGLLIGGSKYGT